MSVSVVPKSPAYTIEFEEGKTPNVYDIVAVHFPETGMIFDTSDIGLTSEQARKVADLLLAVIYYS